MFFLCFCRKNFCPLFLDTLELGSSAKFKNFGLLMCLGFFFLEMS